MKESTLRKIFLPKWQQKNGPLSKLFRNNTGSFVDEKTHRVVFFGIGLWRRASKKSPYRPVGGGDLIGWTSKIVTPDMVGQKIAIFTSIELKTKNVTMTQDQKDWRDMVIEAGGIAEEVREGEE